VTAPPILEIRGLTKRFGDSVALAPLDLDVDGGEYFCILGPSGSGKTTLLRMIAGFESPDAGEIRLGGERIDRLPPERRDTNTVFQGYALFPHLSVFENVAFGLRLKGERAEALKARVAEALLLVGLEGQGNRSPTTLSGGEQQRVALARALVNRPRVLLLDEPLAALDRKLRTRMQGELARIQRESGVTFVHVTHDQEEALRLADRIAVMRAGRFLQTGPPTDVYDRPASEFVADFLGSANLVRARLANGTFVLSEGSPSSDGPRPDVPPLEGEQLFAIRPEAIELAREGDPMGRHEAQGSIRLGGRIERRARVGGVEEIELRVGTIRLVAHLRGPAPAPPYKAGDPVQLFIRTEEVVPLRPDGAEGRIQGEADGTGTR